MNPIRTTFRIASSLAIIAILAGIVIGKNEQTTKTGSESNFL